MESTTPIISSPNGSQNDTTTIYPPGDVTLKVTEGINCQWFLVSSDILRAASSYFTKLFASSFVEGQAVGNTNPNRNEKCPEVTLQDDYIDAMEVILSILHYRFLDTCWRLEPEMLVRVAVQSDKYQCNDSLQPWISQWVTNIRELETVEEYGLLITATSLFGIPEHLRSTSALAIRRLPPSFDKTWSQHDMIHFLPEHIKDELKSQIMETLSKIRHEVECVECRLRDVSKGYEMHRRLCLPCGRLHPSDARQCRPCHNEALYPELCTMRTRIAEYFNMLTSSGLWPTKDAFSGNSIAKLVTQLGSLQNGIRHRCGGGLDCPLRTEIKRLTESVTQVMEGISGLGQSSDMEIAQGGDEITEEE